MATNTEPPTKILPSNSLTPFSVAFKNAKTKIQDEIVSKPINSKNPNSTSFSSITETF